MSLLTTREAINPEKIENTKDFLSVKPGRIKPFHVDNKP